MNREEVTKKLLDEMSYVAENADNVRGRGVSPHEVEFKPFKPGVMDRLYFKKIIDECWGSLKEELKTVPLEKQEMIDFRLCALGLINMFYAPRYLTTEERVLDKNEARRRFLIETKIGIEYDYGRNSG